ncbi:MAG TPA: ChaN family lipoprotein, partial [Nitrospira sp.]|nr:ChaN family lipoprotein [Nitrospira sp.]
PAYRSRILSQLQDCHGGGSPEDYQTMYEASMVRDEGMAKTLAAAMKQLRVEASSGQGPLLSYTGGGHVQYRLPVPDRVARRVPEGLKQVTVYMATFERERAAELHQAMQEGIADYVWLTPQGAQGPPRRCR